MDQQRPGGYWAVVQSRPGMTGQQVWERLEPCMQRDTAR